MVFSGLVSLVRGLLRIVVAAAVFLGIFVGTIAVMTAALAFWLQTDLLDSRTLYLGSVCGLIAWLFLAVFLLRRETLHVPYAHHKVFLERTKAVLTELGYETIFETEDHIRFRPGFSALAMGGGVLVKTRDGAGTITGPRVSVEKVRKRLRLFQHLAHIRQSVEEVRRKPADGLLKRVQVTLRLPPSQWAEVLDHLVGVLGKADALVCDVHLLAQSAAGMREAVIEEQIRDWLHARGLSVELRKEHVMVGESLPPPLPPTHAEVSV